MTFLSASKIFDNSLTFYLEPFWFWYWWNSKVIVIRFATAVATIQVAHHFYHDQDQKDFQNPKILHPPSLSKISLLCLLLHWYKYEIKIKNQITKTKKNWFNSPVRYLTALPFGANWRIKSQFHLTPTQMENHRILCYNHFLGRNNRSLVAVGVRK